MEIIALQEYTDNKISLYEGEIRNISNSLAQKLIEEGIVAEHNDNKQNSSQKILSITTSYGNDNLILIDKENPFSPLSFSDFTNIRSQFPQLKIQYSPYGGKVYHSGQLYSNGGYLFYFLTFKKKSNASNDLQPRAITIKFNASDSSLTIVKNVVLSPSTLVVRFDYNNNNRPNYTFAQVKQAWDAGQTIIFDYFDKDGYNGTWGGVAHYYDGDGDPNYFQYIGFGYGGKNLYITLFEDNTVSIYSQQP